MKRDGATATVEPVVDIEDASERRRIDTQNYYSLIHLRGLLADDVDNYSYFRGDTEIWRVRNDGGEEVQPVSGKPINELACSIVASRRNV